MLKKRISKSIAIALAGITIAAPMLSTTAMAMEKNNNTIGNLTTRQGSAENITDVSIGATVATATSTGRGMYLKIGPGVFTFGTL